MNCLNLLATTMGYAKGITPDGNAACAMPKKALQDEVMRQIKERTFALDVTIPAGMVPRRRAIKSALP